MRNPRLVIFDLDGTLFHLAIDWGLFKRSADDESVLRRIEANGVTDGTPAGYDAAKLRALLYGRDVAVVSRNFHDTVATALAVIGLDDVFIVGRDDVGAPKPDPEGIGHAMKHFSRTPDETVMVGDTFHDVEAAHAAGTMCVIVENDRNAYTPDGADAYVASLDGLGDVFSGA